MHVTPLRPVGARVTGLSLADVTRDRDLGLVGELRLLLAEHGVLITPDQHVDDQEFEAFLRSFGDLMFTTGETPVEGFPDLNVISNVGRTTPPRSQFHVDTSYVRNPPAYTALRAVQVPDQGGSRSGTQAAPLVLTGSRSAVIDAAPGANGTSSRYGFYVAGASYFEVRGITEQNPAKGIVLDQAHDSRVKGVLVQDIEQEGIHLRAFSHHNTVAQNVVRRTGLTNASYGEGLYVGSAKSNWGTYSNGQPDASDANLLVGNVVSQTGAESVDIKEGTTTGWLRDNRFDGAGMSGSYADSWVDVKGNGWEIVGNRGVNSPRDGFQVHEVLSGWGVGNLFRGNTANVRGPGYGFWLQSDSSAVVSCANVVRNAAAGFANRPCQP